MTDIPCPCCGLSTLPLYWNGHRVAEVFCAECDQAYPAPEPRPRPSCPACGSDNGPTWTGRVALAAVCLECGELLTDTPNDPPEPDVSAPPSPIDSTAYVAC